MPAALWCFHGCSGALAAMWMCSGKSRPAGLSRPAPHSSAGTKGIELSNVIQAQSGRRGDSPRMRIKRLLELDRSPRRSRLCGAWCIPSPPAARPMSWDARSLRVSRELLLAPSPTPLCWVGLIVQKCKNRRESWTGLGSPNGQNQNVESCRARPSMEPAKFCVCDLTHRHQSQPS